MQLNAEQLLIKETARQFAADKLAPNAEIWDREGHFPHKELKQMGELGLMGILVPQEFGGAEADFISYALALAKIAGIAIVFGWSESGTNAVAGRKIRGNA